MEINHNWKFFYFNSHKDTYNRLNDIGLFDNNKKYHKFYTDSTNDSTNDSKSRLNIFNLKFQDVLDITCF